MDAETMTEANSEKYYLIEDGEYSYRTEIGVIKTTADAEIIKKALSTYLPYPEEYSDGKIMRYPQSWEEVTELLAKAGYPSEWIEFDKSINLDSDIPRENPHPQKI